MDHQDWNTVILRKKTEKKSNQNSNSNLKKKENDDKIEIKKVSKQMAKQIIDGRMAKKMTQLNLAQQSCIDVKIIKQIESGNCIYNSEHINKISKVLGMKIDRKLNIIYKEI